MLIVYNGRHTDGVIVPGVGKFPLGEPVVVDDAAADDVLARDGFEKVTKGRRQAAADEAGAEPAGED